MTTRSSVSWLLFAFIGSCLLEKHADAAEPPSKPAQRFPALSNSKTWDRLPRETPALPVWARILSDPLPQVTAAMLRLDYVHRKQNPLDPILRGKLRWMAAATIRCEYSKRYAEADLKRAGFKDTDLENLKTISQALNASKPVPNDVHAPDRAVLAFARKITLAAHSVTDEEFAALLKRFGPKTLVAIVHTLAHANFQDRIFLALGIQMEPNGPYPPVDLASRTRLRPGVAAPKRTEWKSVLSAKFKLPASESEPNWGNHDFAGVQKRLAHQKSRKSRIPLPPGKNAKRARSSRIVWSAVSMGYQPKLTQTWFTCMGQFGRESKLDRVFSNSMFWVITRSNECFY